MLDYQLGIGNEIVGAIGFDQIAFLAGEHWVIPTSR